MVCKENNHDFIPTKMGCWDIGYYLVLSCKKCGKTIRKE